MPCAPGDLLCGIGEGVGNVVSAAANDTLRELVNQVMEGFGKALASLGSLWVSVPHPDPHGRQRYGYLSAGAAVGGELHDDPELRHMGRSGHLRPVADRDWRDDRTAWPAWRGRRTPWPLRGRPRGDRAHLGCVCRPVSAPAYDLSWRLRDDCDVLAELAVVVRGGLAVLSVIIAGVKMAWQQRAQPAKELLQSLFTLVVVSGAGLTVIALAVSAADAFSAWVLRIDGLRRDRRPSRWWIDVLRHDGRIDRRARCDVTNRARRFAF